MDTAGRTSAFAAVGYALLVLAAYGDVLFAPGTLVLSWPDGDTAYYFARMRAFAVRELLEGNLPL